MSVPDILSVITPETIEGVGGAVAGVIVAVGAAVGRIRRAVITACKRAAGRGGGSAGAVLAALVLAGCGLTGTGGRLGETDMQSRFQPVPEIVQAIGEACPECGDEVYVAAITAVPAEITYRDGKDKADIQADLTIGGGGFAYSAADEGATAPAEVRARITEAAGDDAVAAIENAFPGGLTGLVELLTGGGAP